MSRYGREARFPFLDEEVIRTIAHTALPLICDLTLPEGHGEKRILRYVGVCLSVCLSGRDGRAKIARTKLRTAP